MCSKNNFLGDETIKKVVGILAFGILTTSCMSILQEARATTSSNYQSKQSEVLDDSLQPKVRHQKGVTRSEKAPYSKLYIGRGDVNKELARQQRALSYSSLEPSGLYAKKGNVLTIGSPERDVQKRYPLVNGVTTITVENDGPIYVTNPNDSGGTRVSIFDATGEMPFFDANKTSVEDFKKQMTEMTDAKDVQLVSDRALITVSYEMAKKYLGDPKALMANYDRFLVAQDRVSGISNEGRPVNFSDRHLQHFLESPSYYMYATNEYMGFKGDAAMKSLLELQDPWGIWHESGHQRQQKPWTWREVVESSVNIYSLAAQKEMTGAMPDLDKYYPEMHAYLNSDHKNFNQQGDFVKMTMFAQLANTFGDDFYPILHQYYRENQLAYDSNEDRMQHFLLHVSEVTGYNMLPYYEQWGFKVSEEVQKKISNYTTLSDPIWLNDNQTKKQLPMSLMKAVSLSKQGIKVDLTNYQINIFKNQKLIVKKNGKVIAELVDKKPVNGTVINDIWQIDEPLDVTDMITIEQQNANGTYKRFNQSISGTSLREQLENYLNTTKPIETILTQDKLNNLRQQVDALQPNTDKEELMEMVKKLQQRYLDVLVGKIELNSESELVVTFADGKLKEYDDLKVQADTHTIAQVTNGKPNVGRVEGNQLIIPNQKDATAISIAVTLPHGTYLVKVISQEVLVARKLVSDLFEQDGKLKPNVTQEVLDQAWQQVNQLPQDSKEALAKKMKEAQQLFLNALIADVTIKDAKMMVTFANDLFKKYTILIMEEDHSIGTIVSGQAFEGELSGNVFTPTRLTVSGKTYRVNVMHNSGTYQVKTLVAD